MKAVRWLLTWTVLLVLCGLTFAQDASPSPESLRAMLQAKKVYILSGHVRYWKTKGFIKKELVDETPFEEPCRKELEKWGRFTLVSDAKDADLVVRAYEKGNVQNVPVIARIESRAKPKIFPARSAELGTRNRKSNRFQPRAP